MLDTKSEYMPDLRMIVRIYRKDFQIYVLTCHGGDHSKYSDFIFGLDMSCCKYGLSIYTFYVVCALSVTDNTSQV